MSPLPPASDQDLAFVRREWGRYYPLMHEGLEVILSFSAYHNTPPSQQTWQQVRRYTTERDLVIICLIAPLWKVTVGYLLRLGRTHTNTARAH